MKVQLLDDKAVEDEELAQEHETMKEYDEKVQMILVKLEKVLHPASGRPPSPVPSTISTESICRQHSDIKNWLGFWRQFKKIREYESVDRALKFHILIQSMKKDSRVKKVVTH